jgi:hypothetical protein
MLRKRPAVAIATSTLAVAATLVMATPASAATVGMKCSKFGYYATGNVNYTNSGSRHNIYSYDWVIHGESGSTKNDVAVTLYRDKLGPDETLNGFASGREKNGYGVHGVSLSYPSSYKLYGSFYFVFDVNNIEPDPRCSGETTRF